MLPQLRQWTEVQEQLRLNKIYQGLRCESRPKYIFDGRDRDYYRKFHPEKKTKAVFVPGLKEIYRPIMGGSRGNTAYRYAGASAAGLEDGTDWDNRWLYTSIPWATLETLAGSEPVYLFLDGDTTSLIYTSTLTVTGSGSSPTDRIFIMPGYAAQEMDVAGTHTAHIGQVIFDLAAADTQAINLGGETFVTVDGYGDPRPSMGNNPKFSCRDIDTATKALVYAYTTAAIDLIVRNMELYQQDSTQDGDGIQFNAGSVQSSNILTEYNYIHDMGEGVTGFAAIWLNNHRNSVHRYNEVRDVGGTSGEGVGLDNFSATASEVYCNLFENVGVGCRRVQKVRFNTFYDCVTPIYSGDNRGETLYYENNIFHEWSNNSVLVAGADDLYMNANIFYDATMGADADIHTTWYNTVADLNSESDATLHIEDNNLVGGSTYLVNPPSNLQLSSEATNAIDNSYTTNWAPSYDFAGRTRNHGPAPDIGAFERQMDEQRRRRIDGKLLIYQY